MSPLGMPCGKLYIGGDGKYTPIDEIKEIEIPDIGEEECPLPKGEVTITFKMPWWERLKLKFWIKKQIRRQRNDGR